MKKSKVFLALGAVLLLISCCSAAGCIIGEDPIVGTWVHTYKDGGMTIYEFVSAEKAYITEVDADGVVTSSHRAKKEYVPVMKTGDNRYEAGLLIYTISEDGYTMTETFADGHSNKFTKYSNYQIPTMAPTK